MLTKKSFVSPVFVTFTGVDNISLLPAIKKLAHKYPIEWGVLIDPEQMGEELFPNFDEIDEIRSQGLRLSAHVCGAPAREIADGGFPDLDLSGFSRLQLNHSREGSTDKEVENSHRYCVSQGIRLALQCQQEFPIDTRADWLYDVSFGTGIRPTAWPELQGAHPLCGFSGGLSPETIVATLSKLQTYNFPYWVDMESGVRSGGGLDLDKCEQVCKLAFGD